MAKSKVRKKNKTKPKVKDYSQFKNKMKMSKVILDYATPLSKHSTTLESMSYAVSYAILIWNLSLLPEADIEASKSRLYKVMQNISNISFNEVDQIVEMMLERRHKEFGHINRIIVYYDITEDGGEYRLDISSHEI